jgi:hypothetical protein
MPATQVARLLGCNPVERLPVHVSFDQRRGYVGSAEGLPIITALSLASLRRQIDARARNGVVPQLLLDDRARQERDSRRARATARARI